MKNQILKMKDPILGYFVNRNKLIDVTPSSIIHKSMLSKSFDSIRIDCRLNKKKKRVYGAIIEDSELLVGEKLSECPHVIALKQRFIEGNDWEDTLYIKLFDSWFKKIKNKRYKDLTWDEFRNKKLRGWDMLFHDIKNNGYKPHPIPCDNVQICIHRTGEILFVDGRHRLVFSKILKIPRIPVIVNLCSEYAFKNKLFLFH